MIRAQYSLLTMISIFRFLHYTLTASPRATCLRVGNGDGVVCGIRNASDACDDRVHERAGKISLESVLAGPS